VEAPTAVSVILAGVLLKMGVYGFLRVAYPLFPTAAIQYATLLAILGVFNILYGACCSMAQDDMKKLVAYSSISHMGFCMLGLAALTKWGLTGAVLQMFSHGLATSMLFLLVGVIYDRAHHRDIGRFGGLASRMPRYAGLATLAFFASMGLPGLLGFISEALVFFGAFRSNLGDFSWPNLSLQSLTVIAALGLILTAAYFLWMLQRVFFGPLNEKYKDLADLNGRELFTLVPLAALILFFGLYPQPLIDLSAPSAERLQTFVAASGERNLKLRAPIGEAQQANTAPAYAQPREAAAALAGASPSAPRDISHAAMSAAAGKPRSSERTGGAE
jgi:NADH-quinone oxidoreductase subunit M